MERNIFEKQRELNGMTGSTAIGMSIITATLPACQMRSMTDSLTS